ncbi:MAG: SDR family oxidoreductase [Proteobacteria bacterium]|nr:SDR family oxidoreductase [Pseudomonadota bacterium]
MTSRSCAISTSFSGSGSNSTNAATEVARASAPDQIARVALFLVSDLAAFVNGHFIVVDGGSTA